MNKITKKLNEKQRGYIMKKIIAIAMVGFLGLFAARSAMAGFGTTADLAVNVNVGTVFGFEVPDNPSMSFAVTQADPNPTLDPLEILCSSNTGNDWELKITGDRLATGINAPTVFATTPAPQNPGDFVQAQGTVGAAVSAPFTDHVLYDSAAGETGQGILIAMSVRVTGMVEAAPGNYSSTITITMA